MKKSGFAIPAYIEPWKRSIHCFIKKDKKKNTTMALFAYLFCLFIGRYGESTFILIRSNQPAWRLSKLILFQSVNKNWIRHTGLYRTMKNEYSLFDKERQKEEHNHGVVCLSFLPLYRPVWRIHFYFNS